MRQAPATLIFFTLILFSRVSAAIPLNYIFTGEVFPFNDSLTEELGLTPGNAVTFEIVIDRAIEPIGYTDTQQLDYFHTELVRQTTGSTVEAVNAPGIGIHEPSPCSGCEPTLGQGRLIFADVGGLTIFSYEQISDWTRVCTPFCSGPNAIGFNYSNILHPNYWDGDISRIDVVSASVPESPTAILLAMSTLALLLLQCVKNFRK